MKILLTGATGLIGKEVGKLLAEQGHEIVSLTRDAESAKTRLPFLTQAVEWKGKGVPFSNEALQSFTGLDGVINLMGENIAEHRWSDEFKTKLKESRIDATRALVDAVLSVSLPKFWVQGSAIGIYGSSTVSSAESSAPFDEFAPVGQGFLAELCRDWEGAIDALPDSVRRVILRTGVVFSHQGGAFPKMLTPLLSSLGGVLGSGNQLMSPVHLDDVSRFVVHAVQNHTVSSVYNLVIQTPESQKQMVKHLCEKLNVGSGPQVPAIALKVALGEMASLLLESQAVISSRLTDAGFILKFPDVNSILTEVTSWNHHPFKANQSVHIQYAEQFVPHEVNEVFPFFSDAKNLESITPEWLNFKIKKVSTPSIEKGTRIRYRLKLHGVPMRWLTDIAEWQPPVRFVDHQLTGPYSLWYHEHTFHSVRGGTLLRDWVRYQLPMGKIGQWVGLTKVRSDVARIFEYRRLKIKEKFGS